MLQGLLEAASLGERAANTRRKETAGAVVVGGVDPRRYELIGLSPRASLKAIESKDVVDRRVTWATMPTGDDHCRRPHGSQSL